MKVLLVVAPDLELDPGAEERVTRRPMAESAELDIERLVRGPSALAPDAAKGTEAVALGAVVVALSASGGVFTAVIEGTLVVSRGHGREFLRATMPSGVSTGAARAPTTVWLR